MNHFEQIPSSSEPIQEAPDGRTGPIDRTGDSSEHARLEVEREAERTAAGLKAARNTISTVIRTARPTRHYKDVFGPEVTETQEPILDLGAGDSNFAEVVNRAGGRVIRCDASYFDDPPDDPEGAIAGLAQSLPFPDDSFATVVSSYLMEHINPEDVEKVLQEILRVTRPGGTVMIYPSYCWRDVDFPYPFVWIRKIGTTHLGRTLVIRKEPTVLSAEWPEIIRTIMKRARFTPKIPFVPVRTYQAIWRMYMRALIALRGEKKGTNRVRIP